MLKPAVSFHRQFSQCTAELRSLKAYSKFAQRIARLHFERRPLILFEAYQSSFYPLGPVFRATSIF